MGEKPSFLFYGLDCHHPTQAATLPAQPLHLTDITGYPEELVLYLSSARNLAEKFITRIQQHQKSKYDYTQ